MRWRAATGAATTGHPPVGVWGTGWVHGALSSAHKGSRTLAGAPSGSHLCCAARWIRRPEDTVAVSVCVCVRVCVCVCVLCVSVCACVCWECVRMYCVLSHALCLCVRVDCSPTRASGRRGSKQHVTFRQPRGPSRQLLQHPPPTRMRGAARLSESAVLCGALLLATPPLPPAPCATAWTCTSHLQHPAAVAPVHRPSAA